MKHIAAGILAALFLAGSVAAEPARWVRGTVQEVDPGEGVIRIDDTYYALDGTLKTLPARGVRVDAKLEPREDGLYLVEATPVRPD